VIVIGFGERCNLLKESKMFVKDEAKISSRVGGVKYPYVCGFCKWKREHENGVRNE